MTLGQKLYEVPSPCGLTCEYGLLERPCWAERLPRNGHRGKPGTFWLSLQLCGPYFKHRAGHYFVPCQILPRRKRKHLPSDAVATSSSEAPANLRCAARRAGGSWTAGAGCQLGSFQEQDPVGCGGRQGFLSAFPHPLTLDFVLYFPRSACLSVPLYSSVEECDDRGADGGLSPTHHSQPPGKAN